MERFIRKHIFLKYARTDSFDIKTTWYAGDIRRSVKGIRNYARFIDKRQIVRLELVLKRKKIKDLGIHPTLSNLHKLDLERFFDFRELDRGKLLKSYLWWSRKKYKKLGRDRTVKGRLMKNTISAIIANKGEKVMEYVQVLKQQPRYKKRYGRFILKLDDFNKLFFSKVKGRSWLE